MKIQVGRVINSTCGSKPALALNIPGIGVLSCHEDKDDVPFDCVILDKKQLKKLRKQIDKELGHEKEGTME